VGVAIVAVGAAVGCECVRDECAAVIADWRRRVGRAAGGAWAGRPAARCRSCERRYIERFLIHPVADPDVWLRRRRLGGGVWWCARTHSGQA